MKKYSGVKITYADVLIVKTKCEHPPRRSAFFVKPLAWQIPCTILDLTPCELSVLNNRLGGTPMYIAPQPLISLIAGILILIIPRLLNYIVALYLIIVGILGLAKM